MKKNEGKLPKKKKIQSKHTLQNKLHSLISEQTHGNKPLIKKEIAQIEHSSSTYIFIIFKRLKIKSKPINNNLAGRIEILSNE